MEIILPLTLTHSYSLRKQRQMSFLPLSNGGRRGGFRQTLGRGQLVSLSYQLLDGPRKDDW